MASEGAREAQAELERMQRVQEEMAAAAIGSTDDAVASYKHLQDTIKELSADMQKLPESMRQAFTSVIELLQQQDFASALKKRAEIASGLPTGEQGGAIQQRLRDLIQMGYSAEKSGRWDAFSEALDERAFVGGQRGRVHLEPLRMPQQVGLFGEDAPPPSPWTRAPYRHEQRGRFRTDPLDAEPTQPGGATSGGPDSGSGGGGPRRPPPRPPAGGDDDDELRDDDPRNVTRDQHRRAYRITGKAERRLDDPESAITGIDEKSLTPHNLRGYRRRLASIGTDLEIAGSVGDPEQGLRYRLHSCPMVMQQEHNFF